MILNCVYLDKFKKIKVLSGVFDDYYLSFKFKFEEDHFILSFINELGQDLIYNKSTSSELYFFNSLSMSYNDIDLSQYSKTGRVIDSEGKNFITKEWFKKFNLFHNSVLSEFSYSTHSIMPICTFKKILDSNFSMAFVGSVTFIRENSDTATHSLEKYRNVPIEVCLNLLEINRLLSECPTIEGKKILFNGYYVKYL